MNKVKILKSKIHGKGLFANKNILKGETVYILKDKIVKLKVKTKKDSLSHPNWFGISKGVWMDVRPPVIYLNHSCDANLGVRGKKYIKALKNIPAGEELTIDYSTIEAEPLWEMPCSCTSKKCRDIVRSITYLPESIFMRYYPYINSSFQKLYLKAHPKIVSRLFS